jgi:hypothetical protein
MDTNQTGPAPISVGPVFYLGDDMTVDEIIEQIRKDLKESSLKHVSLSREQAEELVNYFDDVDAFRGMLYGGNSESAD